MGLGLGKSRSAGGFAEVVLPLAHSVLHSTHWELHKAKNQFKGFINVYTASSVTIVDLSKEAK